MKKCKSCQKEIDTKAKKCPYCGTKQGIPTFVIVIIVIVVIGVLGGALGTSNNSSSDKDNKNEKTNTTAKKENLVLEDGHTGSLDEYGAFYYIEGYIKNESDKNYEYVSIEFTTYDSQGNTLGSCSDYTSTLEANGRWKFKASCVDDTKNIASYKLKKVSGH